MSIPTRNSKVLTWSATDTTVGRCGLTAIIALGSAADSTLTLLDGTDIKIVRLVGSGLNDAITFNSPVAFSNLITDMTGTASYTVAFIPRP